MIQERWLTQVMERFVEWAMSSGIRVLLVGIAMLLLFTITKQVLTRLRRMYEGTLPSPARLKW